MRFFSVTILFVLSIVSCNVLKPKQIKISDGNIMLTGAERLLYNDTLRIWIKNISDKEILINNPVNKEIERYDGEGWHSLRIMRCPCDAPCAPVKDLILMKPKDSLLYTWDLQYTECVGRDGFPAKTVKKHAEAGRYRAKFFYRLPNGETNIVYFYFQILKN